MNAADKFRTHRTVVDLVLFAVLGGLLFASKIAFEALPNIHPVTMLIMVYTVVFGWRAMIPVAVFTVISGVYYGFSVWWIPQIYIWFAYVALTMIIPKNIPKKAAMIIYPVVCGLCGLIYGTLYAPGQALLFGYTAKQTLAWIMSGLPFDALHAAGNLGFGLLVLPLSEVTKKLYKKMIL